MFYVHVFLCTSRVFAHMRALWKQHLAELQVLASSASCYHKAAEPGNWARPGLTKQVARTESE